MSGDEAIFLAVLVVRLGIPLLIPRFPLPAILAALVVDAADQTVFQNLTDLDLENYQSYDKALDVYYLTIAYLSTVRNWADPFAFRVGQFLWYYRLAGVLLFESTEIRALLLVFPNTFEYFFIAYEAVRLWWDPRRLGHRQVLGIAAAIWVFVKLPQEWWIHVAQLDFTDFMKEDVFGVTVDTSWGEAIGENPWFLALLAVVAVAAAIGVRAARQRLPAPDWPFTVDVDRTVDRTELRPVTEIGRIPVLSWYMAEKIALVSMVTTIFAMVLPNTEASLLGVTVAVAVVIIANSFVSYALARRGHDWSTTFTEFLAMAVVNLAIVGVMILVGFGSDTDVDEGALVFFVALLTLIVTLFDRFHRASPGEAPRLRRPRS